MKTCYTLFVDESGHVDIERFIDEDRPRGSSPFLTFGAALVPNSKLTEYREVLANLKAELSVGQLHATEMNHLKTAYFCRKVAELRIQLFGVVSKKATLGDYVDKISDLKNTEAYYNKCAGYLLERVGHWMSSHDISDDQVDFLFEEKRHDYKQMRNYMRSLIATPFDNRATYLRRINPDRIRPISKKDEVLLSLADLTAHALYQSITKSESNFGLPEFRYMRELRGKFWSEPRSGKIANFGLKYIKYTDMNLEDEVKSFAASHYKKR